MRGVLSNKGGPEYSGVRGLEGGRGERTLAHRAYMIVDDVVRTANYYRDAVGFQYERFWGQPPPLCMVGRQGVIITLVRRAAGAPSA